MTDEQKILLVDRLMEMVQSFSNSDDIPIMVGTLRSPQGVKGFETAEVGHPVFEFKDRYIIYLKNQLTTVAIPYYKETLSAVIEFICQDKQ